MRLGWKFGWVLSRERRRDASGTRGRGAGIHAVRRIRGVERNATPASVSIMLIPLWSNVKFRYARLSLFTLLQYVRKTRPSERGSVFIWTLPAPPPPSATALATKCKTIFTMPQVAREYPFWSRAPPFLPHCMQSATTSIQFNYLLKPSFQVWNINDRKTNALTYSYGTEQGQNSWRDKVGSTSPPFYPPKLLKELLQ